MKTNLVMPGFESILCECTSPAADVVEIVEARASPLILLGCSCGVLNLGCASGSAITLLLECFRESDTLLDFRASSGASSATYAVPDMAASGRSRLNLLKVQKKGKRSGQQLGQGAQTDSTLVTPS